MGNLFRSEEMKLVHIYMQVEAARDVLEELGKINAIQFRDVSVFFFYKNMSSRGLSSTAH